MYAVCRDRYCWKNNHKRGILFDQSMMYSLCHNLQPGIAMEGCGAKLRKDEAAYTAKWCGELSWP